jgi:hypothetical protein
LPGSGALKEPLDGTVTVGLLHFLYEGDLHGPVAAPA